jgi:hypothetical protein
MFMCFLGDRNTFSIVSFVPYIASLHMCDTVDLPTQHTLALSSWHLEKSSLLRFSSDTYFLNKLYTLKTICEHCYYNRWNDHYHLYSTYCDVHAVGQQVNSETLVYNRCHAMQQWKRPAFSLWSVHGLYSYESSS